MSGAIKAYDSRLHKSNQGPWVHPSLREGTWGGAGSVGTHLPLPEMGLSTQRWLESFPSLSLTLSILHLFFLLKNKMGNLLVSWWRGGQTGVADDLSSYMRAHLTDRENHFISQKLCIIIATRSITTMWTLLICYWLSAISLLGQRSV